MRGNYLFSDLYFEPTLNIMIYLISLCFAHLLGISVDCIQNIRNPIISGFHPDPCIVRVQDDYYIVNSTFEWFPGIPIFHSKNLVDWQQIGNVLTRKSQLDLTGIPDSEGVYAPSITWYRGLFYVTYTVVHPGLQWSSKGYLNYIVTAENPAGPWSDPVYINSLGFDPSLFIDDDGRGYVVVRIFDYRKGREMSPGIGIHEIDMETLKPKGAPRFIYSGWGKRSAEGPKILKKDGYYYLFTAEGGTGYGHYEAVARAKNIYGPYERAPHIFYTSRNTPSHPIQKAGHGTVFSTPTGEWYTTHLGSRPLGQRGNCPLGRETFLQKVEWKDGWPRLADNVSLPAEKVSVVGQQSQASVNAVHNVKDDFNCSELHCKYITLREEFSSDWIRLKDGLLRLKGREALGGLYRQSILAQRITSYKQNFETRLSFSPEDFRQSAGLCCYYNSRHFYALGLTYDESRGTVLELVGADKVYQEYLPERIPVQATDVGMRVEINMDKLQFYYSLSEGVWKTIGPSLDFSKLSDDYVAGFTGAVVGLFAQDMMYESEWATFDYFKVDGVDGH